MWDWGARWRNLESLSPQQVKDEQDVDKLKPANLDSLLLFPQLPWSLAYSFHSLPYPLLVSLSTSLPPHLFSPHLAYPTPSDRFSHLSWPVCPLLGHSGEATRRKDVPVNQVSLSAGSSPTVSRDSVTDPNKHKQTTTTSSLPVHFIRAI